jgi:hypothetical protein
MLKIQQPSQIYILQLIHLSLLFNFAEACKPLIIKGGRVGGRDDSTKFKLTGVMARGPLKKAMIFPFWGKMPLQNVTTASRLGYFHTLPLQGASLVEENTVLTVSESCGIYLTLFVSALHMRTLCFTDSESLVIHCQKVDEHSL